nr:hypothetical protein [Candidatus Freyarchaeota archaeon]
MGVYRPLGITAMAIALIILAPLGVIMGIIITTSLLPQEYVYQFLVIGSFIWVQSLPVSYRNPLGGTSVGFTLSDINDVISVFYLGAVVFPILSGICVLASYGLLHMKNWGRYTTIILGIIAIGTGIAFLFTFSIYGVILGLLIMIAGIVAIVYLSRNVKYEFQ